MGMMTDTDKANCFSYLYDAAQRLESEEFDDLAGKHLTIGTLGLTLTMLRDLPTGEVASAQHLLAWEEISLTQFDLLDALISDMHIKLMDADPDFTPKGDFHVV